MYLLEKSRPTYIGDYLIFLPQTYKLAFIYLSLKKKKKKVPFMVDEASTLCKTILSPKCSITAGVCKVLKRNAFDVYIPVTYRIYNNLPL